MTKQRRIIYDIVARSREHPTAAQVYLAAREKLPSIAVGTVYRNLGLMVEAGEIRHIAMPDGADRYDGTLAPHEHILCERSGRTVDVALGDLTSLIETCSGCKVTSYKLNIKGVCAECRDKS